jgi:hypothetical protein
MAETQAILKIMREELLKQQQGVEKTDEVVETDGHTDETGPVNGGEKKDDASEPSGDAWQPSGAYQPVPTIRIRDSAFVWEW